MDRQKNISKVNDDVYGNKEKKRRKDLLFVSVGVYYLQSKIFFLKNSLNINIYFVVVHDCKTNTFRKISL